MDFSESARHWLEHEDQAAKSERVARLQWLIANYPPADGFVLFGGWLSMQLLEEAKHCYVYGHFLAAAILGVAFIERLFAAQFFATGRDDLERAPVSDLIEEAHQVGWISQDEFDNFNRVRRLRNPLVHFRRPTSPETIDRRAMNTNDYPHAILARDARDVMESVLHVLQRQAL